MIFICPSCGTRLEKEFKFCPNCGFDLNAPAENQDTGNGGNGHKENDKTEVIVCEVCGEENLPGNDFCVSCGARLKGERKLSSIENKPSADKVKQPAITGKEQKPKAQVQRKKTSVKIKTASPQQQPASLKLSSTQMFMVAGGVIVIIFIILLATGTFDSAPEPAGLNNQQSMPQGNQSSGVDLSTLQQINSLEAAVKANPEDTKSLLQLAHMKNDAGLYDKAIENYKTYLSKHPDDADARVDMGVCYYNLKNYPTAIAEMKKALEYKPDHQIAHLNLGIVNLTAGNLEDSKNWFRKAVEIDPNSDVGKRAKELLESH